MIDCVKMHERTPWQATCIGAVINHGAPMTFYHRLRTFYQSRNLYAEIELIDRTAESPCVPPVVFKGSGRRGTRHQLETWPWPVHHTPSNPVFDLLHATFRGHLSSRSTEILSSVLGPLRFTERGRTSSLSFCGWRGGILLPRSRVHSLSPPR